MHGVGFADATDKDHALVRGFEDEMPTAVDIWSQLDLECLAHTKDLAREPIPTPISPRWLSENVQVRYNEL